MLTKVFFFHVECGHGEFQTNFLFSLIYIIYFQGNPLSKCLLCWDSLWNQNWSKIFFITRFYLRYFWFFKNFKEIAIFPPLPTSTASFDLFSYRNPPITVAFFKSRILDLAKSCLCSKFQVSSCCTVIEEQNTNLFLS